MITAFPLSAQKAEKNENGNRSLYIRINSYLHWVYPLFVHHKLIEHRGVECLQG